MDNESEGRVTLSSGYNFPKLQLPPTALSFSGGAVDKEGIADTDVSQECDTSSSSREWPVDKQMDLLLSMTDLKPVGCLRHWRVLLICERMIQLRKGKGPGAEGEEPVTPALLWPFLHEFYHSNCIEKHLSDNGPFSSSKVKDFDPLGKSEEMAKLLEVKKKQVAAAAAAVKEKEAQKGADTNSSVDSKNVTDQNAAGTTGSGRANSSSQKETQEAASLHKCNNPNFTPITKPNHPTSSSSASKRLNSEVTALNQANKSASSAEVKVETPRSKLRRR